MDAKDFKLAGVITMLVMLVVYAPDWLNHCQAKSNYDAPWIYPGNSPAE